MTLTQDSQDPPSASWSDPEQGEGPGTFAVIIGVSEYPHLEGGAGPRAQNTHGLGQLAVSALTAYRFFRWLREDYHYNEAPLSRCWFLASSTGAELAAEPQLLACPTATLEACSTAINEWHQSIAALHPDHIRESRVIFFFSGHGIEKARDRQILLCSDYLKPPGEAVDDALSTSNILKGLLDLPLFTDILFVDACRTLPPSMSGLKVDGRRVLNEYTQLRADPDRVSAIVYASGSGGEAWQPNRVSRDRSASEDISIFGRALIEGLHTIQSDPNCEHDGTHIRLDPLTEYMNQRVAAELRARRTTARFPVRRGGEFANVCVTGRLPTSSSYHQAPLPRRSRWIDLFTKAPRTAGRDSLQPLPRLDQPTSATPDAWGPVYDARKSERIIAPWERCSVFALDRDSTGPALSLRPKIISINYFNDEGVRLVFSMQIFGSFWIEWPFRDGSILACALQGDSSAVPLYSAEFSEAHPERGLMIALAEENSGWLGSAAAMWEEYCRVRMQRALARFDEDNLEEMLRAKLESPLAATVAGLILLRSQRCDLIHDEWLRNLSNRFPGHPDAPVLWAEQLRQRQRRDWSQEALEQVRENLLCLEVRGLPRLTESFEYAVQLTGDFHVMSSDSDPTKDRLAMLRKRIRAGARYLRPGGLCGVYLVPPFSDQKKRLMELRADMGFRTNH